MVCWEKKCFVMGEILDEMQLFWIVVVLDDMLVLDVSVKLFGCGMWILFSWDMVDLVCKKGLFNRLVGKVVYVLEDLVDQFEQFLSV